jgi:hypothetical protein
MGVGIGQLQATRSVAMNSMPAWSANYANNDDLPCLRDRDLKLGTRQEGVAVKQADGAC